MQLIRSFWAQVPDPVPRVPAQTFFYEVVPSAQVAFPPGYAPDYEEKLRLVRLVLRSLVPRVLTAVGVGRAVVSHGSSAGGYRLRTNPSIQTYMNVDDATSRVVAAAFGWVFRQESVLVADLLDRDEGRTGYATVDFGPASLAPADSQTFFELAASVNAGLGGGYTAFHDDLLYLNVRDQQGSPRSALDDETFVETLRIAAERFGRGARVDLVGLCDARFESNDWSTARDGEAYAELLRECLHLLSPIRREHTEMVKQWAEDAR